MNKLAAIIVSPFLVAYWAYRYSIYAVYGSYKFLSSVRDWRDKKEPTHGNARFSDWKELKETVHAKPDGWYMGLVDKHRVFTDPEACVIGVAPRRTGKSNMAKAQLMAQARRAIKPDVIVFDPHGDLRPATLQTFLDEGYETQFLNFEDPTQSDHYNPVSFVRPLSFHQAKDCQQMMKAVMAQDKGNHEHFTNFPRLLMAGIIAYLQRTRPADAKMHKIVELLIADEASRARMFDEMVKSGGSVERAAVTAFRNAGERERGSFSTTMAWKLDVWLRPGFIHVTEKDGFTWNGNYLNPKPVVTFITTGGSNIEGAAARLILSNAINTRLQMWPQVVATHNGKGQPRFPKDLRIVIDEGRLLGNCEAVVTAVTETGKMGVSLMMWLLGMRDIHDIYPEASVITNSCNAVIFGGGTEMSTYEDFSRMIGEKTVENAGYSESDNGTSQSWSEQARRVAKADQLRAMDIDHLVAIMGNVAVKPSKPFYYVGEGRDRELRFR